MRFLAAKQWHNRAAACLYIAFSCPPHTTLLSLHTCVIVMPTSPAGFFAFNQIHADLQQIQAIGGSTGVNSRCLTLWEDICTATGPDCNGYRGAVCAATSCPDQASTVTVSFQQLDGKAGKLNCTRGNAPRMQQVLKPVLRAMTLTVQLQLDMHAFHSATICKIIPLSCLI